MTERMTNETKPTVAGEAYTAAHSAHYGDKKLRRALEQYKGILAAHPDSQEAGFARAQIINIMNSVVPKQTLYEAQYQLAMVHATAQESSGAAE